MMEIEYARKAVAAAIRADYETTRAKEPHLRENWALFELAGLWWEI